MSFFSGEGKGGGWDDFLEVCLSTSIWILQRVPWNTLGHLVITATLSWSKHKLSQSFFKELFHYDYLPPPPSTNLIVTGLMGFQTAFEQASYARVRKWKRARSARPIDKWAQNVCLSPEPPLPPPPRPPTCVRAFSILLRLMLLCDLNELQTKYRVCGLSMKRCI